MEKKNIINEFILHVTERLQKKYTDFHVIHHEYNSKDLLLFETSLRCHHLADISLAISTPDVDIAETSNVIAENFIAQMTEWENTPADVAENIELKIVNYEKEKHFLSIVPHVRFLDLAAYYYYSEREDGELIDRTPAKYNPTFLTNDAAIFTKAKENTLNEFYIGLSDAEHSSLDTTVFLDDYKDYIFSKEEKITALQINKEENVGAFLLNNDLWDWLAEHYQSDLLIVPISTMQFLALPYTENGKVSYMKDVEQSSALLKSTAPYLYLSNNCYRYSRGKHEIAIA